MLDDKISIHRTTLEQIKADHDARFSTDIPISELNKISFDELRLVLVMAVDRQDGMPVFEMPILTKGPLHGRIVDPYA